ncbi:MAG: sulfatase-like hydrolase/transferase, partial [Acidobacteria bacterium]|nr:sulfatase-like hydrolase/transferase [Acidobacteriota bacterium]
MMDQISARWLWGDAAKAIPTPHFDALKARGVAFRRAFTSNPVCCPARATLATGLTTRGHGVLQNGYELDPALPTFMRLLQQGGWRTGAFGKVHYRVHFHGVHPDYRPYGFDVVHNTEDARAGYWLDWVEREHPDYYERVLATIWPTEIAELKAYGPRRVNLSARIQEIRKNFRWATPEFPHNTAGRYTLPFPDEVSQTEWITGHALDFIQGSDRARPIYAHISYVQPHSPFCPPGRYMKDVDEARIPAPCPVEWLNDPLHPRCFPRTEGARTQTPADWRTTRHYYLADLVHLDRQLGRVMEALEQSGRAANTYFILLADHGELLLDHGFSGKAERHYDACVRIPLLISGPGLRSGAAREEIVQLEDIFPTVLEMAGIPQPRPTVAGPYLKMPEGAEGYAGRSLLGLCKGETPGNWRDQVYIESYNNISSTTPEFWARTIRTADWRYTLYPGGNGEQLFSLRNDLDEGMNRAGDAAASASRREMRDRL